MIPSLSNSSCFRLELGGGGWYLYCTFHFDLNSLHTAAIIYFFQTYFTLVIIDCIACSLIIMNPVKHVYIKQIKGPFTLAKTKIKKTWVFCCTVYTARKTHNIRGFWHEKRMREKTRISYLCFGKWCACATSLYPLTVHV